MISNVIRDYDGFVVRPGREREIVLRPDKRVIQTRFRYALQFLACSAVFYLCGVRGGNGWFLQGIIWFFIVVAPISLAYQKLRFRVEGELLVVDGIGYFMRFRSALKRENLEVDLRMVESGPRNTAYHSQWRLRLQGPSEPPLEYSIFTNVKYTENSSPPTNVSDIRDAIAELMELPDADR